MTEERTIVPGNIEGFLAGCPFCTAKRKGAPEVGERFRFITGGYAGRIGTVVKPPEKYSPTPSEVLSHLDGDASSDLTRVLINYDLIQVLPEPPVPGWAPPLSMQDAAPLDLAVVNFCENSFTQHKSEPNLPYFYELIRVVWQNRIPLQPKELHLILKAHGIPSRFEQNLLNIYENGINLLIHVKGRKPIKKKIVKPFSWNPLRVK